MKRKFPKPKQPEVTVSLYTPPRTLWAEQVTWPKYSGSVEQYMARLAVTEEDCRSLTITLAVQGKILDAWRYPPGTDWLAKVQEMQRQVLYGRYDKHVAVYMQRYVGD